MSHEECRRAVFEAAKDWERFQQKVIFEIWPDLRRVAWSDDFEEYNRGRDRAAKLGKTRYRDALGRDFPACNLGAWIGEAQRLGVDIGAEPTPAIIAGKFDAFVAEMQTALDTDPRTTKTGRYKPKRCPSCDTQGKVQRTAEAKRYIECPNCHQTWTESE